MYFEDLCHEISCTLKMASSVVKVFIVDQLFFSDQFSTCRKIFFLDLPLKSFDLNDFQNLLSLQTKNNTFFFF